MVTRSATGQAGGMQRFSNVVIGFLCLSLFVPHRFVQAASKPGDMVAEAGFYGMTRVDTVTVTAASGRSLLFTEQFLAFDGDAEKLAQADTVAQAREIVEALDQELKQFGANLQQCLRLHVCLSDATGRLAVEHVLTERLRHAVPAVSYVVGELPVKNARVGIDAVAYVGFASPARHSTRFKAVNPRPGVHGARHAQLPPGRAVFVSGQAVKGEDMADSAQRTMAQLAETLAFLERGWSNVVQIKTFLRSPSENAKIVSGVIAGFFEDQKRVPPQIYVEWTSNADLEIELVVVGGPPVPGAPAVEYLVPPGLKPSPVFSRVTRTNGGRLIYTSGISGPSGPDATEQVKSIFADMERGVAAFGGDLRHLVKATYYVGDPEASRALNEVRPGVFDADRPPAASKALVKGVGLPGVSTSIDMIAVGAVRD